MNRDFPHRGGNTRYLPGLIIAAVGVIFLLDNLHIFRAHDVWEFWPLILIAIGISKLVDTDRPAGAAGPILIGIGGLFLITNLGLIPWSLWQFWPVILIAVGLLMLFDRDGLRFIGAFRVRPSEQFPRADAIAIFGGFKRRITTEDFRGANYVAVFGGGEVDLRRARIQADSAVIEVSAIFGGFELRVPPNWLVHNEVTGVFGGAADETRPPLPEAPDLKHLTVRGSAVFGGVGIKN